MCYAFCTKCSSDIFGAVNHQPAVRDAGGFTLNEALISAIDQSPWLLGTFGGTSIAIFRNNGMFFIYDSHLRNHLGLVDPSGSSVHMHFDIV